MTTIPKLPVVLALSTLVACGSSPSAEPSAVDGARPTPAAPTPEGRPIRCLVPCAFAGAASTTSLLVVGPEAWASAIAPLIAHKNTTGIPALFASIEDLTAEFTGVDDPEKLKQAIVYANQHLKTKYVMLVGEAQYIPFRHRFVAQPPAVAGQCAPWLDGTYNPSELFYSNLYTGHSIGASNVVTSNGVFSSWDANLDGKYDEEMWSSTSTIAFNPDQVDGYPDIALGRVPATSAADVTAYVNKVIAFENGMSPSVGGNHFTFLAHEGYPGSMQLSAQAEANLPIGTRSHVLLDVPAGTTVPSPWFAGGANDIFLATGFSNWVSYIGHGWRFGWVASNYDETAVAALTNGNFPVVMGIACQTGEFALNDPVDGAYQSVDLQIHELEENTAANGCITSVTDVGTGTTTPTPIVVPVPSPYEPLSGLGTSPAVAATWILNPRGGAIAYFGETVVEPDDSGTELEGYLFKHYTAGGRVLGDLWQEAGAEYWVAHKTDGNILSASRIELGVMTLFGDPSLRIP